jgi:lipopolysaccharide/colanic/teichoic acid biosynthesis glycosyltransferase
VGPEALSPDEARRLEELVPDAPRRLAVRPGLTGLAQIGGVSPRTFDPEARRRSVALDLSYVEKHNAILDFRILLGAIVEDLRQGFSKARR